MQAFQCPIQINASVIGESLALICGRREISYSELHDMIYATARRLISMGIRPNDRVATIEPSTWQHVVALLAIWRIGGIVCPISTRLPEIVTTECLQKINAKAILTSQKRLLHSSLPIKKINFEFIIAEKDPDASDEPIAFPMVQESSIILTSGSTARPKAVVHTFGNHFYNAKGANEHIPVKIKDRWILSLPLYHVSGLSVLFRVLLSGGTIVVPDNKEELDDVIEKSSATHVSMVNTQLFRLLATKKSFYAFRSLKAILLGGGPVPKSLVMQAVQAGLPIYLTYGLTEMASQVATSDRFEKAKDFLADPDAYIEKKKRLRVLNYRTCVLAENNEILVSGQVKCLGYWEEDGLVTPFDDNGFFRTGDLGENLEDGSFIVTGRKDNMFISGGENIQPEEIEERLAECDGIEQAIVLPVNHSEHGSRPVAVIKEIKGHSVRISHVCSRLDQVLPKFKIPEAFYAWPDETDDVSVKVSRQYLTQLVQQTPPQLRRIN